MEGTVFTQRDPSVAAVDRQIHRVVRAVTRTERRRGEIGRAIHIQAEQRSRMGGRRLIRGGRLIPYGAGRDVRRSILERQSLISGCIEVSVGVQQNEIDVLRR